MVDILQRIWVLELLQKAQLAVHKIRALSGPIGRRFFALADVFSGKVLRAVF